jgi:BirA family biotin operon repressor/biotin-[acetyl-CoA-carboxylase] ligase
LIGWPPGIGLVRLDAVDSTNAEARRRAEAGEAGPLWITAARQSAGKGRRGRDWETGEDNLAATLLLRPDGAPTATAQLSFAAALAVTDMAVEFAPHAVITLKWPNDVLAEGKKLAGILLEAGHAWLAHWQATWQEQGFEPLRTAWLARAQGLGGPIHARLPHEERHGAFEGIDASGALLLREPGGVRAITAGEVFF